MQTRLFKTMFRRGFLALMFSVLFSSQAQALTVSVDNTFVAGDSFASDFHTRLNRDIVQLEDGVNNVVSAQVVDDTLTEADMADEINPRIRTYEGAACEFVYSGLLPTTTSGTLVGSVPSGTAYPRGYRIIKSSATAKTWTATKWTYVDLDISGNFTYPEQTIDGSAPAVTSNSIRLARVSTDSTQVIAVQDLRKTSCADGPFSAIADASSEATLGDLLSLGIPVRRFSPAGRTPSGHVQGAFVSWDTHTTFKVTSGGAYIGSKYRAVSTDTTVTTATDAPLTGGSGIDTGAIGASTTYYVYLAADQESVATYSVTFSSSTAPAGVTNYRLIGMIKTDATSLFTSRDVVTVHGISERETIAGWVKYTTVNSTQILDSYNVSGITDDATGVTTIAWDYDFNNVSYDVMCNAGTTRGYCFLGGEPLRGSVSIATVDNNGASSIDQAHVMVLAIGDSRK